MSRAEFAVSAETRSRKDPEEGLGDLDALAAAIRSLRRSGPARSASGVTLLAQLDEDARAALQQASSVLLEVGGREQWRRLAIAACEISGALLEAYAECRGASDTVLAAADLRPGELESRLARAAGDRILWEQAACQSPQPRLWEHLNSLFEAAVARRGAATDSPSEAIDEYVRAIALYGAGVDQLDTSLIPVLDGVVRWALTAIELRMECALGALYAVVPESSLAPQRLARPLANPEAVWFFSPVKAAETMAVLARRVEAGAWPPDPALAAFGAEHLLAVIAHLRRHWGGAPPVRRYRRHLLEGRLAAVCGFEAFRSMLAGEAGDSATSWGLRDISRGGVGAIVSPVAAEGLGVGALVGMRAEEGGGWHLGVVRRISAGAAEGSIVGIETLSHRPTVIKVDDGRAPADVVACDPLLRGEAVRIAAPLSVLRPGVPLFVTADGSVQKLKPLDGSFNGCEFELRVYQIL